MNASSIRISHHRLRFGDQEEVIAAHQVSSRLLVEDPPRGEQSRMVRTLDWSGSSLGSDAGTWVEALSGTAPRPQLLAGEGIRWAGVGFTASGAPSSVTQPLPDILL